MAEIKQECKLCDKIIIDESFKVIEDVIKAVFDVLLLKLTLDTNAQNVMCTACSSKLLSALNFKSTCIHTDHTLISYADFENPTLLIDLKEVYIKRMARKLLGRKFDNREICRLCLRPISSNLKSIQEVPVETIEIYIPEIAGKFPSNLKTSTVIPIEKVNGTNKSWEFRPINTLPSIETLLEMAVYQQFKDYIDKNNLHFINQSGFRNNHSCQFLLQLTITERKRNLDNGDYTIAVFLDLKCAFETTVRSILLLKLKKYWIEGKLLEWFRDYLY